MSELVDKLKSETAIVNLDGFDGYTDESEGDQDQDQSASPRVIQGMKISFDGKKGAWLDANKQPLPADLHLIVADVLRVVQKWRTDNTPAEPPIILGPNEKWPDVDAMNAQCPKTEWRMYYDKLIGPYQKQKIVYLWDPVTMNKYTWPASNNSGMACVSDLVEKIMMMRSFKKVRAIPVVKLSSLLWSKKNNTLGPRLIDMKWIAKSADGTLLPATEPIAIASSKPTTVQETLDTFAGVKTVDPPTGKEATGDKIIF
jgi:hypothetical protein